MELKRICDTITCWENTFTQELRQTAQTEVIVPDTCPDVVQLYENSAMVFIDSRRAMDGKIEVAGSVRCEILYQAAEEELVRLETTIGFTAVMEDDDIRADDTVLVSAEPDRPDIRIINSRKLAVNAGVLLRAGAYRETTNEICKDVDIPEGYGIRRLVTANRVETVEAVKEKTFTITDRFEIERAKSGAEEILRSNVNVTEQDHKLIGRKIILKGVITVDSMYRSFEGQVENASFELPFSQIMETEGNEDARCDLSFLMRAFLLQPEQDSYYEGRNLELKAEITVQAVCRSTEEIEVLEDIYSVSHPMQTEYEQLMIGETRINTLNRAAINENEKKDKSGMPSVVMRMTEAGEALWDLARQYDTTVEAIASANSLSGARTLKRGMLLVPVMG
ncbi:MAG: DUF3794 domain-containing protein [Clostridiales bacterium]|jgi:LysM repeat protein|nr:DUF3794 domain-containing protein [Clostridiales bacterium]